MAEQSTIETCPEPRRDPKPAFPLWVTRAAEAVGREPEALLGQIDELLYDGWQPSKVRSKLQIPEQQESSLEAYAKKYRYRRVIAPLTRIREALVGGAEPLSKDCVKLFGLVMQQSLAEGTDEGKRQRAAEIMLEYMDRVERIGQRAETLSKEADATETKQSGGPAESAEEMLRRVAHIFDIYGIKRDGKN